jgi:hypothetical protein
LNQNFRFQFHFCAKPYARRYRASTSNRRGAVSGQAWLLLAVLLTLWPVTWLDAGTPHGMMIPQRSVLSLSWFVGVFKSRSNVERGAAELAPLEIPKDRINILTPEVTDKPISAVSYGGRRTARHG